MALIDDAVLSAGTARFYTAPVGTAYAAPTGWEEIGHTSLDNVVGVNSEGGDVTTLGTLQKKQLRTTRSPIIDRFRVDLQQWDEAGLKLYHGSNMEEVETGTLLGAPVEPIPTTCAWKMVVSDAGAEFGIYAAKAEIFRGDAMEISNDEGLSTLPLDVQPLQYLTNKWAYAVTPLGTAPVGP